MFTDSVVPLIGVSGLVCIGAAGLLGYVVGEWQSIRENAREVLQGLVYWAIVTGLVGVAFCVSANWTSQVVETDGYPWYAIMLSWGRSLSLLALGFFGVALAVSRPARMGKHERGDVVIIGLAKAVGTAVPVSTLAHAPALLASRTLRTPTLVVVAMLIAVATGFAVYRLSIPTARPRLRTLAVRLASGTGLALLLGLAMASAAVVYNAWALTPQDSRPWSILATGLVVSAWQMATAVGLAQYLAGQTPTLRILTYVARLLFGAAPPGNVFLVVGYALRNTAYVIAGLSILVVLLWATAILLAAARYAMPALRRAEFNLMTKDPNIRAVFDAIRGHPHIAKAALLNASGLEKDKFDEVLRHLETWEWVSTDRLRGTISLSSRGRLV